MVSLFSFIPTKVAYLYPVLRYILYKFLYFYIVNYIYTQNPEATTPIMLIDKHIGVDANGVDGIIGSQFAKEVIALQNSGKTNLEVWINSKGGNVADGWSMYGSLINSSLNVTTVNMGLVDSTAGWIFQAGNTRKWSNYALGLIHNVGGAGKFGEEANNSIATMLASKTNQTIDQVRELMKAETMLTSEMAKQYGFCDEVIDCTDILQFTNSSDIKEITTFGDIQIKKTLPKKYNMNTINTILGLANEASQEAVSKALTDVINAKNASEAKVAQLTSELTNANNLATDLQTKLVTAEAKILEATNASIKANAEALVKEHVGKRITDSPETIKLWVNSAIQNYEGTKAMIESMALNVEAPKMTNEGKTTPVVSDMGTFNMVKQLERKQKRSI